MCIYIYIYMCIYIYICVYKCIKYANYIPIYYQHIPIIYPSYYTTYAGETAYQLQLHSHVIFPPLMVKSVKSLFIQLLFFPSNHIESTGPKEQASLHHFFDEGHDAFGDYTNICYQYLLKKTLLQEVFQRKSPDVPMILTSMIIQNHFSPRGDCRAQLQGET